MPSSTAPRNVIYTSWLQADLTATVANPPAPPANANTGTLNRIPAAYATPDGAARVVYPDNNFNIIELYLASGAGSWQQDNLTAITQAPISADVAFGYVTPDGTARVVYTDVNSNLTELYLTSDAASWQYDSLSAITQAPTDRVGCPFALTGPDGLPRVYYTASNSHVIELRLDPGGWIASDLTVSVSNPPAPPALAIPFAYVTPDGALRVIYPSDGDIIELYLTSDAGSWQQDNLTAITQAPTTLGRPFGYVTPDGAARVIYPPGNGDIIELRLASDAGSWQQANLTAITHAPQAAGVPFGYVTPDGPARFVYSDGNGDIIELRLASDAGSWQQANLTAITQAPPESASSPFAYVTPDGTARVVYTASNGHVIELRLQPED